jgi:hypothetical protein
VLNHRGPEDRGDREQDRPPELLAEHLGGMAGVFVVATYTVVRSLSIVRMMSVPSVLGAYRWTVLVCRMRTAWMRVGLLRCPCAVLLPMRRCGGHSRRYPSA